MLGGVVCGLFLIVLATWIPATRIRWTAAGRHVLDHQIDLVVSGLGALVVTAIVYLFAR